MKRLRTTRHIALTTTALAALTLSGAAAASANTDSQDPIGVITTVVDFGAYTSDIVANPAPGESNDHDPTVDATNNTLAVSPDERYAVVTQSYSDRLLVIRLTDDGTVKAGQQVAMIKGYVSPRNILFHPDGKSFFVSDSARGVVDRISMDGEDKYKVMQRLPLGAGVFGTALSEDGKQLYANNAAANTVTIVDIESNRPTDVITGFSEPRQGTKLSPKTGKLYVTNYGSGKITAVDLTDDKHPTEHFGKFDGLRAVSVNDDGTRLYAANSASDKISIVDLEDTDKPPTTIPVGKMPYGAALSPDDSVLLTGNKEDNTLTVVDPSDDGNPDTLPTVLGTVKSGSKGYLMEPRQAISFSADSKTAWVLNKDLTIAKIDVQNREVIDLLGES